MPEHFLTEEATALHWYDTNRRESFFQKLRMDLVVVAILVLLLLGVGPNAFAQAAGQGGSQNGEKPATETESARASGQISESQLAGLPLNGRSYSQLATLQAGVSDPSAAGSSRGVSSGGLTVSGGRRTSNSFLLDGTNIMNTENEVPRSAAGVQLGSDAVHQVQVFGSQYSAEYGRNSGGVLNSITRSGTPEFHGSFFEFFRNEKLDSRNFFDNEEPPPFKRNQFGFTLTGPVVKERTFFMGSFEAMRDRLTRTETDYFPDLNARAGRITRITPEGQAIVVNPCVDLTNQPYCVAESVRPYLQIFPVPNAGSLGGGIGENHGPQYLPTDENFFTVRLDHQISTRDSMFVRYTFDDASSFNPAPAYAFKTGVETRQQYLTLMESHVFSPSLVNSFRFGYTRPVKNETGVSDIEIPTSLYFAPGAPQFGQINVPGLTPIGPLPTTPETNTMNTFQFADDVVWQRGSHSLKFGFQAHRYRWDVFSNWQKSAYWSFNSLESFLRAGPEGTTVQVALPGSSNDKAYRQTLLGFYGQDAYRVRPGLQFDLGLRYEFTTLVHDQQNRDAFLEDPLRDPTVRTGRFLEKNPSLLNLSPRAGLSWSPLGNASLVIRAGAGIYYDQLLEYVVDKRKNSAPFYQRAVRTNFDASNVFPRAVEAVTGVPFHVEVLDYKTSKNPMVLRYDFSVQQELSGGWETNISYVGARGNHLFRSFEANEFPFPEVRPDSTLFFPAQCDKLNPPQPAPTEFCRTYAGPINPAFSTISYTTSDAQSFYNSLRIAANKRIGQGVSLQGSYTFSKSVDDTSSDSWSGQYGWDRKENRGLSEFDVRHRIVFNYFYTLPFGAGRSWLNSGVLSQLFGGWRLGGIVSWRNGIPYNSTVNMRTEGYLFSPSRPNLLPGQSKNPTEGVTAGCGDVPAGQVLGTRERYYDPCVFAPPPAGTMGNAGRNTIIAPSVFNMDLSLQKEFSLDSKRRLQFRAEVFNLPNHTNFNLNQGGSTIVFRGASGARNSTAGRLGSTSTTSRQIQFALRFSF